MSSNNTDSAETNNNEKPLTFATRQTLALGCCSILVIVCQLLVLLLYPILTPRFSNNKRSATGPPNATTASANTTRPKSSSCFKSILLPSNRVEWASLIEAFFLGLAVSTLVSDALFHLLPAALISTTETSTESTRRPSILELGFWAIGGMLLVIVIEKLVHFNWSFSCCCKSYSRKRSSPEAKTRDSPINSCSHEAIELASDVISRSSIEPRPIFKISRKISGASSDKSTEDCNIHSATTTPRLIHQQQHCQHQHSNHHHNDYNRHHSINHHHCQHGFANLVADDDNDRYAHNYDRVSAPPIDQIPIEQNLPSEERIDISSSSSASAATAKLKCFAEPYGQNKPKHRVGRRRSQQQPSRSSSAHPSTSSLQSTTATDRRHTMTIDSSLTAEDDNDEIETVVDGGGHTPSICDGSVAVTVEDLEAGLVKTPQHSIILEANDDDGTNRNSKYSQVNLSAIIDNPQQQQDHLHSYHRHNQQQQQKLASLKKSTAWTNLIAELLHNFVDGLGIGIAFSAGPASIGIATSVAIFAHEVPSQAADFIILLRGGFAPATSYCLNFAIAFGIHLGAFAALYGTPGMYRSQLQMLAAGNFLCLGLTLILPQLQDFISQDHHHHHNHNHTSDHHDDLQQQQQSNKWQSVRVTTAAASGLVGGVALITLLAAFEM